MNRSAAAMLPLALAAAWGCRGSVPSDRGDPGPGAAAVLIGMRTVLQSGEGSEGETVINMESDEERGETYRLPVSARRSRLFEVAPGTYRMTPARGFLGGHEPAFKIRLEGASYRVPFPREILRKPPFKVRAGRVYAVGVIEARFSPGTAGRPPELRVSLDDGVAARRRMVEQHIRDMMDPRIPLEMREYDITWSRALQNVLVELAAELETPARYKSSP